MALGVLHNRRRAVKAHGLVVEQRGGERREIMALEISAGIGEQREAGGVRFWKAVERERGDGLDDLLLGRARDPVALHAGAQLLLDLFHARLRAFEAHGAPQLLGLAARESRRDHGHAQQLLLK